MKIRALHGGLEFFEHVLDPSSTSEGLHRESAITVAGNVISVLRTDDLSSDAPRSDDLLPDQVRVTEGDPFGSGNRWRVEIIQMTTGKQDAEVCVSERETSASTLHPSLTGKAILYACLRESDPGFYALRWYLSDFARYLPAGARDAP